eukprot:GHVR01191202.1.p1 GENE.GHVR01191202.1~~GHVR01191202.1.p1  ORF type:complete len:109 (-),score=28.93 GHVR01191202.1:124-420(-)
METQVVGKGSTYLSRGKYYTSLVASVTKVESDDTAMKLLLWNSERHYESILFVNDSMRDLEHKANTVMATHSSYILNILNNKKQEEMNPIEYSEQQTQ